MPRDAKVQGKRPFADCLGCKVVDAGEEGKAVCDASGHEVRELEVDYREEGDIMHSLD